MESLESYNKKNEIRLLEKRIEEIAIKDRFGYRIKGDIKLDLSAEELAAIKRQFGDAIESVTDLSEEEKEFLKESGGHYRKTGQSVMQFFGGFHPEAFEELERECVAAFPCLRWVYFDCPPYPPRKILLESRSLDLKVYNLEGTGKNGLIEAVKAGLEAERRKGFLLTREAPIRIRIYQNSRHSFAALLCWADQKEVRAHFNGILKTLFPDWKLPETVPTSGESEGGGQHHIRNQYAVSYWKNLLKDYAGGTKVPGYFKGTVVYEKASALFKVDQAAVDLAEQACSRCGLTFRIFLETVWGLLLMKLTGQYYSLFGIVGTRGILKIRPLLVTAEQKDSFFAIGRRVQKQVREGERFSACTEEQIERSLCWKEPLFTHLLEFHTFDELERFVGGYPAANSEAGSGGNSYLWKESTGEAGRTEAYGLIICFSRIGRELAINVTYDRTHYAYENIKLLQKMYFYLLREAALHMERAVGETRMPDITFYQDTEQDRKLRKLRAVLFLKRVSVFRDIPVRDLFSVAEQGEYRAFVANDLIYSEGGYIEKVDFIVEGSIEVGKMSPDKIVKKIMVKEAGQPVTLDGLIPAMRCSCSCTAVSNEVLLFSFAREYILSLAEQNPVLFSRLLEAQRYYCNLVERKYIEETGKPV